MSDQKAAARRLGLVAVDCDVCTQEFFTPAGKYIVVTNAGDDDPNQLMVSFYMCSIECADRFVRGKVEAGESARRWLCTEADVPRILPCQIMSPSVG